jgi:putative transposase
MNKITRVEKHQINSNHPLWPEFDNLCFKSKSLYNYANFIQRQKFIKGEKIYKASELDKLIQHENVYKELGSQSAQKLLRLLEKNWKSFFVSIKDWAKNPNKYLGKPNLPKYKKKNGRYICELKNIQSRIENGYIRFSLKRLKSYNNIIKTNIKNKVLGLRIIPKGTSYILELVYEKEIQEHKEFNNKICSIDLGVNNFATLTNNIGVKPIIINGKGIKSINQYYNKKLAKLRSDLKKRHNLHWSNRLDKLQRDRDNKIEYFLHCASKSIIEYCNGLDITTIVIGLNKTWKQESSLVKSANQNFIYIPYNEFINKIKYKAIENGIHVIINEESYSSGTSFLDLEEPVKANYDKSRRVYRGLFVSNKGIKINSDVNGSLQIMKKVFPNAFADGIEGIDFCPIRVNIVC